VDQPRYARPGNIQNLYISRHMWDRLEDFIKGEQQHSHFPCNFTKDIVHVNLPHFLQTPRAHSPELVLRSDLLPILKLESHPLYCSSCYACININMLTMQTPLIFISFYNQGLGVHCTYGS
jgi:hypothetical protein